VSVVDGVAPFRFYDTNGALTALGFSIDANTGTVTGTIVDPSTYGGFSGYGYDLPVLVEVYAIDAVGLTAATAQAAMVFLLPNQAMQPKAAGANVGNAGVLSMNFVGAKSVTNTAGAVTVDLTSEPYIRARLATAAALPTNAYLNGTSGVGATLTGVSTGVLTVDGQAVALNDLVLAKNEAAPAHNGAYKCTVAGAIGVAYVLTRDVAMDEAGEFTGTLVTTGPDGSANSDIVFECTAVSPVVVGTTAITFQSVGMASGFLRSANNLSDVASAIASIDNISKISTAISAGATTDLTTATGDTVSITSGATITSFGNGAAGIRRVITFAGVSTLVHNPSQLDLITQANITTVIGDKCEMVAVGSNQWVMVWYQRYDGTPLVGGGVGSAVAYGVATGTNTYAATMSPVVSSYTIGALYLVKFTNGNSGASTIDLGPGAKTIQQNGVALSGAELPSNCTVPLLYDAGGILQIVGTASATIDNFLAVAFEAWG
jgi:hypothetical protein